MLSQNCGTFSKVVSPAARERTNLGNHDRSALPLRNIAAHPIGEVTDILPGVRLQVDCYAQAAVVEPQPAGLQPCQSGPRPVPSAAGGHRRPVASFRLEAVGGTLRPAAIPARKRRSIADAFFVP